jgi:uncharacterized protein involved in outer membrane biogenesis
MSDAEGAAPGRRRRWPWIAGALAGVVAVYAFVGFQLLPGIVRSKAIDVVRTTYGRELGIGTVALNPFLLQVEVRDLAFPDADRTTMVGARRVFVDLELASLWRRAWVFRELTIEAPYVHAVRASDGRLNLSALVPPSTTPAEPPKEDAGIPALWIQALTVTEGGIDVEDRARRVPLVRRFAPVAFSLADFRTTAEGGDFRLSASSNSGERFDWKGRFALAPAPTSQGEFSIAALRAPGVAELLGDALPFGLSSGTIDLSGTYRVVAGDVPTVDVKLPSVRLADVALRARGADADWVKVPSLTLGDVAVSMPSNAVTVATLAVRGLDVDVRIETDGRVNLQRLFAPGAARSASARETADARATTAAAASTTDARLRPTAARDVAPSAGAGAAPARAWTVALAGLTLDDARIRFEDRTRKPVTAWTVAPLTFRSSGLSLDLTKPLPVDLTARVNDHADVAVRGQVTPAPLAASLDLSLAGARLAMLQPYVLPYADLTIRDGTATVTGHLDLNAPGTKPSLAFGGDLVVANLRSTDNALNESFFDVGRLQVQKLKYTMAPDTVAIDRIVVKDPYARVIVSRDAVLNVSAVLDPVGTAAALQARKAREAAFAKETPEERKRRERLEAAAEEAAAKKRKADARKVARSRVAAKRAPLPEEKLPIRIREVRIDGGRLNFSDFNVQPNFAADVRALGGTLTGLSSAPTSRAKMRLTGNVGEFSPVEIGGELQPFAFDRYTDVGLKFSNISLPVFNPYSGRFAGYNIAKGKLDTEIHYRIVDRALEAKHHIRIDQLEWGEETPERAEASLPVKFATVLLRDRNGVIDLNLPISGTLDDPKFRVGPIVWQVIKNIVLKAVTAPFALLGALFGGGEEAQFVDFAPGATELEPAQVERLAGLAKALVEKPGLKLDVPIGAVPALDGPALQARRYADLLDAAVRAKQKTKADARTPAFDTLDAKTRIEILTALVQKQTGAAPKVPEPPAPPEGTPRAEARALRDAAALEFLAQAARSSVTVGDADYAKLGEERANAVQRALLADGTLEPARVFVVRDGRVEAKDGKARVALALK